MALRMTAAMIKKLLRLLRGQSMRPQALPIKTKGIPGVLKPGRKITDIEAVPGQGSARFIYEQTSDPNIALRKLNPMAYDKSFGKSFKALQGKTDSGAPYYFVRMERGFPNPLKPKLRESIMARRKDPGIGAGLQRMESRAASALNTPGLPAMGRGRLATKGTPLRYEGVVPRAGTFNGLIATDKGFRNFLMQTVGTKRVQSMTPAMKDRLAKSYISWKQRRITPDRALSNKMFRGVSDKMFRGRPGLSKQIDV